MTIENLKLGDYIQHIETGKVIEVNSVLMYNTWNIDNSRVMFSHKHFDSIGLSVGKEYLVKDFRFYRTKRGFCAGDVVEVVDNSLGLRLGARTRINEEQADKLNFIGDTQSIDLQCYYFGTWQLRVVEEAKEKFSIRVSTPLSKPVSTAMEKRIEEAAKIEEARNVFKAFASYAENYNKTYGWNNLDVFRYMSPLYENYNHIMKGANMGADSKSTKLYFKDSNGNMIDAEFPSTETIKLMEKFEMERFDDNKIPMFWKKVDRIYHNDKTVIVYWTDGTSTRATCSEDDTFDITVGLLIAVGKKAFSNKEQLVKIADKLATNGVFENTSSVKE